MIKRDHIVAFPPILRLTIMFKQSIDHGTLALIRAELSRMRIFSHNVNTQRCIVEIRASSKYKIINTVNKIIAKSLESDFDTRYEDKAFLLKDLVPPLSNRTLNALNSNGVKTLSQLEQLTISDVMKFRNFGRRSLLDVEKILNRTINH